MATVTETYDRDLMIVKFNDVAAGESASTTNSYHGFVVQMLSVEASAVAVSGVITILDDHGFDVASGLTFGVSGNTQFTQNGNLNGGIAVDGQLDILRTSGGSIDGTYTITLYIARYQ